MTGNILFICGSLNQTTMMHKISKQMEGYNCFFTPYYADGVEGFAASQGWLDFTVLGGRHMRETREYLARNLLPMDDRGTRRKYDLVVTCSDLIVQRNIRNTRLVLIQEGITEPETWVYHLVKWLHLPRYIANTSTSGLSNAYDVFCVASEGYADLFVRKGVKREKLYVTGIPNFDDLQINLVNDFPFHGHVLVATSPLRETFRRDDRDAFIRRCVELAAGRKLIFKLHPAENVKRAQHEINRIAPDALVFSTGNVNHMIANAATVITQQSTSTYVAVGLGKETHTNLNMEELKRLMPIQNNGDSARRIAGICRRILHTPMPLIERARRGTLRTRPLWENIDL
ncbi:MAG: hypothetical protein JNM55_09350 [Anaerolineales bacterium]|nr:hypothetical protein [Anaerolineales bacterium]